MAEKDFLEVGDVIKSRKFAFGDSDEEDNEEEKIIFVDGETKEDYDQSRGQAKFVVEEAQMEGGGTGMGPGDVYPDGWAVYARRLHDDGTYDPKGEVIMFYMSGCFNNMVYMEDIEIVGKMKRQFA